MIRGAFRGGSAADGCGVHSGCETDLKAAPDIDDIRWLHPDASGKGLHGQRADLVREQQPYSHCFAAEAAQVQCQFDGIARQRDLEAQDLCCHEVAAYLHVLPWAACVGGDEDIDCGTVGRRGDAGDSCWDVGDWLFKSVARDLLVPGCLKPVDEIKVTQDKRRHSEISVQGFAVQAGGRGRIGRQALSP